MKRFFLIALFAGVFALLAVQGEPAQSQDVAIRAPNLGINHISAPNDPIADQRYLNALMLGVGWNRWPLYWNSIETSPGGYDWSAYDQVVSNDLRYGLRSDAILLGIPGQHYDGGRIRGLSEPIFSDGSDAPGGGKLPNPNNPYASFVYAAVMRYKPGGTLAAQRGWGADQGIRVWEAWNEPDLPQFWSAPMQDYARLLKVTYLIVRQADPLARVMFGGLAYIIPGDYLAGTLALIAQDPDRGAYNWYFDMVAVHSYTDARRSGRLIADVKEVLASYGLDRPVWLNESGVPVWDDYPGPTWTANQPSGRMYRGTMEEQALYMIESTAQAWAAGAEVVFIFQLYDDCGNQPLGTDFPPDSHQAGDAYGLFRNDRSSPCFSQSPQPNTPRPAASALYRMAQVFGSRQLRDGMVINLGGHATIVSFDLSPAQGVATFGPVTTGSASTVVERAYVMWNRSPERVVLEVPASGRSAQLYDMNNVSYVMSPQDGKYEIGLPSVTRAEYPLLTESEVSQITGDPYILVEPVQQGWTPVDPQLVRVQGANDTPVVAAEAAAVAGVPTVTPEIAVPPTPTAEPTFVPTTDPALDHTPPIPYMLALPETSPATFDVHWGGQDDSGISSYIVWVRVDGGDWQKWQETADVEAAYTGTPGSTYEFALWAVDLAGNWSENVDLPPQAMTKVQ
ncbi:MAG: fibronectin type III domain-containing protein [Anaerolineae bacterium]